MRHLQHTFPASYKSRPPFYSAYINGLKGCSYLQLPRLLKFFTAGIEYHHIHHLNTRIPCYRLHECHQSAPQEWWASVPTLTLSDIWPTLGLGLYDEARASFLPAPFPGLSDSAAMGQEAGKHVAATHEKKIRAGSGPAAVAADAAMATGPTGEAAKAKAL